MKPIKMVVVADPSSCVLFATDFQSSQLPIGISSDSSTYQRFEERHQLERSFHSFAKGLQSFFFRSTDRSLCHSAGGYHCQWQMLSGSLEQVQSVQGHGQESTSEFDPKPRTARFSSRCLPSNLEILLGLFDRLHYLDNLCRSLYCLLASRWYFDHEIFEKTLKG